MRTSRVGTSFVLEVARRRAINAVIVGEVRLLVVDDHDVVREGLRAALGADPDTRVVADTGSGEEALQLLRRCRPDVLLTDFRLADMGGDVLCRRALADFPSTIVVVLTTYLSEEIVRQVADAGAHSFVTKAAGLGRLRSVLAQISAGRPRTLADHSAGAIVRELQAPASDGRDHPSLTPQQERVLELTIEGLTYTEIGARLFISESTVRFHIQRLKARLGVHSKAELIATAIRSALVAPGREARID